MQWSRSPRTGSPAQLSCVQLNTSATKQVNLLATLAFIYPGEGVESPLRENLENRIKKVRSSLSVPKPALGVGLGVFLPAPVLLVLLVYR